MKPIKTEQQNPHSRGLDAMSTIEILRLLNCEDARVASAVRRALPKIARAVDAIVKSIRGGGKLVYVGAGTSGRLAMLDAVECPPTFGTPSRMVQAIIAGGKRALRQAVEGAEDSAGRGARDLAAKKIKRGDVVVGITASGATRYVLGATNWAKRRGAVTVGVSSNPHSPLARRTNISITLDTGPEAIAGSTRMKAGTALKMVLHMLSTASMVRLGRIYGNWMIYVALTNQKLRQRGERILIEAAGASPSAARHALRQSRHNLPVALLMLLTGANKHDAERSLAQFGGNVSQALRAIQSRRGNKRRRGK